MFANSVCILAPGVYHGNMTNTAAPAADTVARTIRAQFGPLALMSAGARDFAFDSSSLYFTVRGHNGRLSRVRVTLEPSDTYTLRVSPLSLRSTAPTLEARGAYFDTLAPLLDSFVTGAALKRGSAWEVAA